jgi:hypothetical protein
MVERASTKCFGCNIQGGDSGLEFRSWLAIELDGSNVHPELGRRLCVSGRILRVDLLKPETPTLGAGDSGLWLDLDWGRGLDGSDSSLELGRRLLSPARDSGAVVT